MSRGPRIVVGDVWRSGLPLRREVIALGVRQVFDLTRRHRPVVERACRDAGIAYTKIAIDETEPDTVAIEAVAIRAYVEGSTLVHCFRGVHRTGAVAALVRLHAGHARADVLAEMMVGWGRGHRALREFVEGYSC